MLGSYGGVVYKYNKHIVKLSFPYRENGPPKVPRGLAYTGKCYNSRVKIAGGMSIAIHIRALT
jgi:hypothetical protein